ncbi:transmembrane O-mannosyltransferase targeting cadherins 4 [Haematobia irritans]|uniref:transmembrane O-mannosyltransferase targeting cadherins 4 n=1 Tax=Haematobia irritans TaxID=7368 RepID=UPI003F4F6F6D
MENGFKYKPSTKRNIPIYSITEWQTFCLQVLVVCFLCYFCYGSALNGSFVFDDNVAIKQNKAITQVPTNYTAIFLTSDFWGTSLRDNDSHKSYRPLTSLMFHFEWVKWKMHPYHMKAINLVIHVINSLLVLMVLKEFKFENSYLLSGSSTAKVAFVAAVLFAVHPIHTEAVAGIVSRADLLFCSIYLLCLWLCTSKSWWYPPLIIALTFLGVFFKETAITTPLACMLVNFGVNGSNSSHWKQQLKKLCCKRNLFYALSTFGILLFRLWIVDFKTPVFRSADNPIGHAESITTRILSQNFLYFYNIKIMMNPLELCFDWSFECIRLIESFGDSRLLLILSMYVLVCISVLNYYRHFPPLVGLGLLVIPFLPASGIIKVGFVIAERVLYVPSIGFCYLVAYGFICLCEQIKYKNILRIGFGVVIFIHAMRCRQRANEWLTEDKLFSSALNVCPNNAKVHYNIARLATDIKNSEKAFYHYHKAIELASDYDAALMNLGNLYRDKGNLQNAEKYIKKSLEATPGFATAWMNLGIVQAAQKNYADALESYRKALKYRKNYANCFYNMGNLFLEQNLHNEALKHWQYAVALKPSLRQAWANILTMYDTKSMFNEAVKVSEQALRHLPLDSSIAFLRANVFGKLGRYNEAESLYKQVIAKEPLNYLYHTNLAILYHRWNRYNDAIDSYKKAIDANPQKALTAKENLTKVLNILVKQQKQGK